MKIFKLVLVAITVCLLLCVPAPTHAQDPVADLMSRMSVEDKVGQLFLVPFVGSNVYQDSDIWTLLTEYKVGGVILQEANSNFNNDASAPRQIAELTNSLKTVAFNTNGIPLFVSIDHEGDDFPYTHITEGVTPIPSQMAIGATWDTAYAEAVGRIVGEELSAMGLNMVLGPSLDVLNDPRPTGRGDIGTRVFGGDPYWVGQMGRAYIRGIHAGSQGRMLTVAKHFPGHGGSDRLPDNEVATVDKSLFELNRIELPPFYTVLEQLPTDPSGRTDALMSSHIRYRGFQGDIRQFTVPISFDAEGMKTLLGLPEIAAWREEGGLIVSDALGVPAVRRHFDPSLQTFPHRRIVREAFLAGNDVLSLGQFDLNSIWSNQFANIKDSIFFFRNEYINNPSFAEQVDASVARILRLKLEMYPDLSQAALNVDPHQALNLTGRHHSEVHAIARNSLTLLYPSLDEFRLRVPQPPGPADTILVIADTRLARSCYTNDCAPEELFLPRHSVENTILRLYGPNATGQIQPDRISTITFAELKHAMVGAIAPPIESDDVTTHEIQVQTEEVRARIQAATWLVFAALDLNTSRFPSSDALKLFLSQESGVLRDKTSVVIALNAPYYLDTTEVTKLTAYFGLYSKTTPHIEVGVRALFGEAEFRGASPVSVESIGYRLADVVAPDADQKLRLEIVEMAPASHIAPVTLDVSVGPVIDHNGHVVPDNTPIEVQARVGQRVIATDDVGTVDGVADLQLTLTEPGEIQIVALAGQTAESEGQWVSVAAPPTATAIPTLSPTPTPTRTPTPRPTQTPTTTTLLPTIAPTATASPTLTPTPPITAIFAPPPVSPRPLDGLDLLSALAATLLAGLLGFGLGQQYQRPLSGRVRLGLWALIGGLAAYLLYGAGVLRPEQWLMEEPTLWAGRVTVAGLAFIFGMLAMGLTGRHVQRSKSF